MLKGTVKTYENKPKAKTLHETTRNKTRNATQNRNHNMASAIERFYNGKNEYIYKKKKKKKGKNV